MMPYDTYRLYQAERGKSPADARRADERIGRLASAVSRLIRAISRPAGAAPGPCPAAGSGVPRRRERIGLPGSMVETLEGP